MNEEMEELSDYVIKRYAEVKGIKLWSYNMPVYMTSYFTKPIPKEVIEAYWLDDADPFVEWCNKYDFDTNTIDRNDPDLVQILMEEDKFAERY
jgi:hypothetical protein